ncbi:MAG: flippase, partial [Candidatus Gracilibacteria bacterium]
MSLARKIFSNTAWQVIGKGVTAVLGIISVKFITNYLSPSTYGEYTTIYDYTALFAIVADFGLFTIAVREMALGGEKGIVKKIVNNVLSLRLVLAVSALGLGTLAAALIPAYKGSHIPFGVLIVSIATIITLIAGTMSSVLQYYLKMVWASVALTIGKIVTVAYILVVIIYIFPKDPNAGFPHLLFAWIVGGLVTILITYIASSRNIKIAFEFDFSFWKTVLLKALPYGLALVLGTIYFRMGTVMLSLFNLKTDAGYYGVPLRFLEILQIVPHYFMNSVLPILTVSLREGSERTSRILKYSINSLAALAFPIFVGGYILAWPLTAAVSSPDFLTHRVGDSVFYGSDMALKILLAAMVFTYIHVVLNYAIVAMGRQAELFWINGFIVILNVSMNLFLVPRYGFIGAAVAAVSSEVVMLILLLSRVVPRIKNIFDFPFLLKTVFSSVVMGGVLFLISDYFNQLLFSKSLLVLVPIGGLVFAVCMIATRALTKEMLALIKKSEPP